MQKRLIFYLLACLAGFLFLKNTQVSTRFEKNEAETNGPEAPSDWFFAQRAYPYGRVNPDVRRRVLEQARALRESLGVSERDGSGEWQSEGPLNMEGRISALAVHPNGPQRMWAGTASGGIFKTTDGANSWTPVFDEAMSLSIGDLAVSKSNPDILYVGTGESNGGGGSVTYDGVGVYKTSDGGDTWQHVGLEKIGNVGRIAIDPTNPNRVFVAAMGDLFGNTPDRGVYRSENGGQTWEQVLFASDSTGAIDIIIHPSDPQIVYAATWERIRRPNYRTYGGPSTGIWRSADGGSTWTKLSAGLPKKNIGRIGLTISPANPNRVYASFADSVGNHRGIYRTDNGINAWQKVDVGNALSGYVSSFGWWFGRIYADPNDADKLITLGLDPYLSEDGGQSWNYVSDGLMHVDQHALWMDPSNPQHWIIGGDGGLHFTDNGGFNWQKFPALIPCAQFYGCELDEQNPERLYGGLQDNGTWRRLDADPAGYSHIYGGDGFTCLVDPSDNNYIYAQFQYGGLSRTSDGDPASFLFSIEGMDPVDRRNWSCPIVFDPADPKTLYFGTNRVYKSTNRAELWEPISPDLTKGLNGLAGVAFGTLTTLGVSPLNTQVIWAGSDDGRVHVTQNGGDDWADVGGNLPDRWVTRVVPSPHAAGTAFVTLSGFRWHEYQPHVLRTTDFGQNWTDISGNLPEAPVSDLIQDPTNAQVLWVSTDMGVFGSSDGGQHWNLLAPGMPLVPVTDLRLHAATRKLVAATYGRGLYSIDLQSVGTKAPEGFAKIVAKISPNPLTTAGGQLEIQFSGKGANAQVDVLDVSGRLVKTLWRGPIASERKILDVPGEIFSSAGIYWCRVRAGGQVALTKIVFAGK